MADKRSRIAFTDRIDIKENKRTQDKDISLSERTWTCSSRCHRIDPRKNGEPNNTVHFHILTDDPRTEEEIKRLLKKACERKSVGLVEDDDFTVGFRELSRPETCFDYFTKRNRTDKDWCRLNKKKRVILFEKGTGMQKFYEIGEWCKKKESELWEDFVDIRFGKKRFGKKTKRRRRKNS